MSRTKRNYDKHGDWIGDFSKKLERDKVKRSKPKVGKQGQHFQDEVWHPKAKKLRKRIISKSRRRKSNDINESQDWFKRYKEQSIQLLSEGKSTGSDAYKTGKRVGSHFKYTTYMEHPNDVPGMNKEIKKKLQAIRIGNKIKNRTNNPAEKEKYKAGQRDS